MIQHKLGCYKIVGSDVINKYNLDILIILRIMQWSKRFHVEAN